MIKAEQELGAFFSAVKELSGSAQPELSAENWLHELPPMSRLPLINSRMATATGQSLGTDCKSSERPERSLRFSRPNQRAPQARQSQGNLAAAPNVSFL
jgi:hypothetical protein